MKKPRIKVQGISQATLMKVFSVALALTLWAGVVMRGQNTITMEVPVRYMNVGQGLQVADSASEEARTVTIEIKGHEKFLSTMPYEDVFVVLDLKGLHKGIHQKNIEREDVRLPRALRVTHITPGTLTLRLEETIKKTVAVRVVITGMPQKGYTARSVEVIPGEVVVEGAKSEVRALQWIDTRPVNISGASETVAENADLDTGGRQITLSNDSAMVTVIIVKGKE